MHLMLIRINLFFAAALLLTTGLCKHRAFPQTLRLGFFSYLHRCLYRAITHFDSLLPSAKKLVKVQMCKDMLLIQHSVVVSLNYINIKTNHFVIRKITPYRAYITGSENRRVHPTNTHPGTIHSYYFATTRPAWLCANRHWKNSCICDSHFTITASRRLCAAFSRSYKGIDTNTYPRIGYPN